MSNVKDSGEGDRIPEERKPVAEKDRREWDPGNYGNLDRERGPGQDDNPARRHGEGAAGKPSDPRSTNPQEDKGADAQDA